MQQNGQRGSIIGDLHLLRICISKPAAPSFLAKNGANHVTNTTNMLNRMAEHFSDVLNCNNPVDHIILQQISHMQATPDADSFAKPLSAAEIFGALPRLSKDGAPGSENISVELPTQGTNSHRGTERVG